MTANSRKWLAIRVDGDTVIGLGHVMRCLALAEAAIARGYAVRILSRSLDNSLAPRIASSGASLHVLEDTGDGAQRTLGPYFHSDWLGVSEEDDVAATLACIAELATDYGAPGVIIVDHYALGRPWHMRARFVAPVLAVDELADRPLAPDWLVDQTVGRQTADYAGLVPDFTRLLLEGDYALLRSEFTRSDSFGARDAAGLPGRILIALGAVDRDNVSARVIEYLASVAEVSEIEVTVIAGGGNLHADALRSAATTAAFPVAVLTDISNMADVMSAHDIVIGAGGTSAWERCALGLPALTIVLAENQRHIAEHLEAAGAAINLGSAASLDAEQLAAAVAELLTDAEAYSAMSAAAVAIADGHGCDRVLDIIESV